jgi:hypothetical protein
MCIPPLVLIDRSVASGLFLFVFLEQWEGKGMEENGALPRSGFYFLENVSTERGQFQGSLPAAGTNAGINYPQQHLILLCQTLCRFCGQR